MRRRDFIAGLGGTVVWPLALRAQQPLPVIGFLSSRSPSEAGYILEPFRRGLREAGYLEGQNVRIEYRWAEHQPDRLPAMAADLVARQVNVIVAGGTAIPAKAAILKIPVPVVFTTGEDPVTNGLVEHLNRPGGNITGATFYSGALIPKQLELLREFVSKATIIGMLITPGFADVQVKDAQNAARVLGQQIRVLSVSNDSDVELAFASFAQLKAGALLVSVSPFFDSRPERLVALAAHHAMPAVYYLREFVTAGGLISYGASISNTYRQAGVYAGRILKGEKPGDLPVMLPTKFELAVNLKTAKSLGLTVPATLLATADEVIQ
jgi:putative tryptophan/tyrosine transport system substrate-binding protein